MAEMVKTVTEATADLPKGFKMTELGLLPEEWQVVPLSDITVRAFGGGTPSTKNSSFWGGAIPWITTSIIGEDDVELRRFERTISEEGLKSSATAIAPKLSLLVGTRVGVGKAVVATFDVAINQDITALVLDHRADPYFIAYLLKCHHYRSWFEENKRGTTIKGVPRQEVLSLLIPLPSLDEQNRITRVLHSVQRAKEATEKVLAAARELKKSLMRYLFTYGPVPVEKAERVPLKETEIGLMPEHWQIVRLEDVVQPIKQIDPKKFPEQRFRYIDVSSIDNQQLRVIGHQDLLGKYAPSRARKLIKAGDVIFATVRPYLKRIALVPPEYDGQICSTAFCVLRADDRSVISNYLFSAVSHDRFVDSISEYQRGSSYPAVTDGDVLRGLIPLPPLSEQKDIASILRTVDDKIQAEEVFKHALDVLFNVLLHLLMTGRIRVKDLSLPETEGVASGASRE